MKTFTVWNSTSGLELGEYEGATGYDAILAMLKDANCHDRPTPELCAREVRFQVGTYGQGGEWHPVGEYTETVESETEAREWIERIRENTRADVGDLVVKMVKP